MAEWVSEEQLGAGSAIDLSTGDLKVVGGQSVIASGQDCLFGDIINGMIISAGGLWYAKHRGVGILGFVQSPDTTAKRNHIKAKIISDLKHDARLDPASISVEIERYTGYLTYLKPGEIGDFTRDSGPFVVTGNMTVLGSPLFTSAFCKVVMVNDGNLNTGRFVFTLDNESHWYPIEPQPLPNPLVYGVLIPPGYKYPVLDHEGNKTGISFLFSGTGETVFSQSGDFTAGQFWSFSTQAEHSVTELLQDALRIVVSFKMASSNTVNNLVLYIGTSNNLIISNYNGG